MPVFVGAKLRSRKCRKQGDESRGGAWSRFHALEPGGEILQGRVERLADTLHEVEHGEEKYVGHAELVAGDEGLAPHQLVEPGELVARRRLQLIGRLWNAAHPALEHLQPFAEAEAVE